MSSDTPGDTNRGNSPALGRARRVGLAVVVAGGLALGAVGIAAANGTTTPNDAASVRGVPAVGASEPGMRRHGGHGMLGGRGAIRGEFVVPKAGGGYQTVTMQHGVVTKVSSSAITVKSADGASKTFVVTANTIVNAARDGISTVKKDDQVRVVGVKQGDETTAVRIADLTRLDQSRQRFGFSDRGDRDAQPRSNATPS